MRLLPILSKIDREQHIVKMAGPSLAFAIDNQPIDIYIAPVLILTHQHRPLVIPRPGRFALAP